jgi:hypothetical protein
VPCTTQWGPPGLGLTAELQAAEQCLPEDGGCGECKTSATVRLVCSGWKCRHDALVMWLLLGQDATDEGGVLVRRGGGSLASSATALTR